MNVHNKLGIYRALIKNAFGIALFALAMCFGGRALAISNTLTVFFIDGVSGQWSVDGGSGPWHAPSYTAQYPYAVIPSSATIWFRGVFGYYTPSVTTVTFTADNTDPNPQVTYVPWSSTGSRIGVSINYSGQAPFFPPQNATWSLIGDTDFMAYVPGGTGSMAAVDCPPETYSVTFNPLEYQNITMYRQLTPASQSKTINAGDTAIFTSRYARITGDINVNNVTEGATWQIVQFPGDFAQHADPNYLMKQTNSAVFTNCPAGTYVVQFYRLDGWDYPVVNPQTNFVSEGHPADFEGVYQSGLRLRFHTVTAAEEPNLAGLGSGSVLIIPTNAGVYENGSWYFTQGAEISVFAIPSNVVIGAESYDSFFYMWRGTAFDAAYPDLKYQNPISITVTEPMDIDVVFSREYFTYDNVGDLDHDMLPDEWERRQGNEWPTNAAGPKGMYGQYGNPDGDTIPSTGTNPPVMYQIVTGNSIVTIGTNSISTPFKYERYLGVNGSAPAYPLSAERLSRGGYTETNGVPFANLYECRGLDQYYKTNGPFGPVPNDDPGTSPILDDSDIDELQDGWEYYFWYWRSADAFSRGLSNSANLSWVSINPRVWNESAIADTDGDGLVDLEEYEYGTDPTHVDTDGDFTDDWWEMQYRVVMNKNLVCNPLSYIDAQLNPDADAYAYRAISILTHGTSGTAFTNVLRGSSNNWNQVWVDNDTNDMFTLYTDTILACVTPLINGQTGFALPSDASVVYAGAAPYRGGVPVWASLNANNTYETGDVILINLFMKHSSIYMAPPLFESPGESSFDPRTAWTMTLIDGPPDTANYTTLDEYLGGDYVGRLFWGPGGNTLVQNDNDVNPGANGYTDPSREDSDNDLMPDGWELYVGLNPNSIVGISGDADADPDKDGLNNQPEWANTTHPLGMSVNLNKLWPSDPGQLSAPQPNDIHSTDTDWDGVSDGAENAAGTDPCRWDTDGDRLPDGWEMYAGTDPLAGDFDADTDGDGLKNWQEYLTGAVPEWQMCDPAWGASTMFGRLTFFSREPRHWERSDSTIVSFIPPDFLSCPTFLYLNGFVTDLAWLRANYPALGALQFPDYHTTLCSPRSATNQYSGTLIARDPVDSDMDGFDDYWEVFHGLNPLQGGYNLMDPIMWPPDDGVPVRYVLMNASVGGVDADPSSPMTFQFGLPGVPFSSFRQFLNNVESIGRFSIFHRTVGPFNFGLEGMDPDGDGLPNGDEYSYRPGRSVYHTDPTPIWRTDQYDTNSFVNNNYQWDLYSFGVIPPRSYPFTFETQEGFDTDNDGVGDYVEVNRTQNIPGSDPQDARNPSRNRALLLNGKDDFARTQCAWYHTLSSVLSRFCVEAWVKPVNPASGKDQVIIEKGGIYPNAYGGTIQRSNFRLAIDAQGLPYIMYNGRGAHTTFMAKASISHRLSANKWAHIAGIYDGVKLVIFVDGVESMTLQTYELPATGYHPIQNFGTAQTIMIGATDPLPGEQVPGVDPVVPTNGFFKGYVDEIRVWDGARTRQELLLNKIRRLPPSEVNSTPKLYAYYTFDDVPDPTFKDEMIVPAMMAHLDTTLSFHPTINWWANYITRSRVYIGSTNMPYNYIVMAEDHCQHRPVVPPMDDVIHITTTQLIVTNFDGTVTTNLTSALPAGYRNVANPYNELYNDYTIFVRDLLLFNFARGAAISPSWLETIENDPDATDVDGDGLPDNWEVAHGLDPNDPTGENGAWGDPDLDGLNNRAEYLAGTDPWNSDSDGDGIGDYDDNARPGTRTWGELYSDGDEMPDEWEVAHGLDPYHYDAEDDNDGDGWSNLAEYYAGTNPNASSSFPKPYFMVTPSSPFGAGGNNVYKFYQTNTMDGFPLNITQENIVEVNHRVGAANGTAIFTGYLPLVCPPETMVTIRCDANRTEFIFQNGQFVSYSGGAGGSGTIDYKDGMFTVQWPDNEKPQVNSLIFAQYAAPMPNTLCFTGFKEGSFYVMAFLDQNGNNEWDNGEPLGIPDNLPFKMSYNGYEGRWNTIYIYSEPPTGYGRFKFAGIASGAFNGVAVTVNYLSMDGAPTILTRYMRCPRDFLCEWDFQLAGFWGLPNGNYQWHAVNSENPNSNTMGTFNINWPSTQIKPRLVYPRGERLIYARNTFQWTMDDAVSRYHMQIVRWPDGATVLDDYYMPQNRWPDVIYELEMPILTSEIGEGVYFWRIAGMTPYGESEWSDWQTFEIDLSTAAGSRSVSGSIYYYGKVPATNIIVEAYSTSMYFTEKVGSRVMLSMPVTADPFKGDFTLSGLRSGSYRVRAYIDSAPAISMGRNNKLDSWESRGVVKNNLGNSSDYEAEVIDLYTQRTQGGRTLVIRDRNTDNDELPDAWEMTHFGNLDQTGQMDYDKDGINNVTEYALENLNTDPTMVDTDGDRLSDYVELTYDGSLGYNPYSPATKAGRAGTDTSATTWDTDGDQFSDGLEVRLYRTNPLDPNSYPRGVAPGRRSFKAPADYDGDGATDLAVYDPVQGTWFIMSGSGTILAWNEFWGGPGYIPVAGDYDGDFRTDMVVYDEATGYWFGKHIAALGGDVIFWGAQWGGPGLTPVAGDYDGDLVSDFAVIYKPTGAWYIMSANGTILSMGYALGGGNVQPVAGDYNADCQADMTVYANGQWASSAVYKGPLFSGGWGAAGLQPVSGDFNGDGLADMAVYSEASGTWYISTLAGKTLAWGEQWGGPGFSPLVCDLNGDGAADVAVYDRQTGMWYAKVAGGNVIVWGAQWGGPGLVPVSE